MQIKGIKSGVVGVAVSLLVANPAAAFDMGNMMNPSKWMGGGNNDRDRYDDYYDGPGYGYGGPGYGYGGLGYGVPAPGAGGNQAEIEALKQRMNQLEQGQVK